MRTKIICGAGAVICALFLLAWMLKGHKVVPNIPNAVPPNQSANTSWPAINHQQKSNALADPQAAANQAAFTSVATSNAYDQRTLKEWQAPIEFYGKVIDGGSNPVSAVKIHFRWTESPDEEGEKTADTQSDSDGLFSLHDKHGASLDVSFSKDGYYSAHRGHQVFNYALAPSILSPDSQNPVIFILQKKGKSEPLIRKNFPPGIGQIAQLHRDGTPADINLLTGEKASPGSGQLVLESWRNSGDKNAKTFDWKLSLSAPGGGLIETGDEFAFEAPDTGYEPTVTIDMPATNQNWQAQLRNKFYIQLPDGSYGRFDLYFLSYNGVFTVHSTVNPSGSRNLESGN